MDDHGSDDVSMIVKFYRWWNDGWREVAVDGSAIGLFALELSKFLF
ncbi:hypothetical protein [Nocardia goodfellowii]|uniref:Uncharacterized protein n=1 Tax=Nocardia goodfellowii TaxID=882446 RepID=A0ABS4QSK8_9NOCA|nr:hypothetical protein [Nocardia goodfellowii]MBP2194533.1 hypothetical protein [Nocardia goodfellowii]